MEGIALKSLSDEQLEEQIKSELTDLLADAKLLDFFSRRFSSLSAVSRQSLAARLLAAITLNNESVAPALTTKKGIHLPPTVANWLKDFLTFTQGQTQKKEEYFRFPDFLKMEAADQDRLKRLFALYDLLFRFSSEPAGLEPVLVKDENGRLKIFKSGELSDFSVPEPVEEKVNPAFRQPEAKAEVLDQVYDHLVQANKTEEKKPVASFHFSPEDEEEINKQSQTLSAFNLPESHNLDEIIEKIITDKNLIFDDDVFKKRFESIARSRLKEIRSERDTFDLFTRSKKIGGLEFPPEKAQQIIDELNKEIPNLALLKKSTRPTENPTLPQTPAEALKKTLTDNKIFRQVEEVVPELPSQDQIPVASTPQIVKVNHVQNLYRRAIAQAGREADLRKKAAQEEAVPAARFLRRPVSTDHPRLEDIRSKSRTLGPIDELREMRLEDFRKLGTARASSVQKVYDKLGLLREDSFTKYAEGIKAWRDSDICRLYIKMGQASMEKGKGIREIIEEFSHDNQPYLSESEFNAVADLNKKIRF